MPNGLVGLVVLVEDSDGNVMGIAKVGDMGVDAIDGMVGLAPGLTGVMKAVDESVAYTAGKTLSPSSPSELHPRFD